MIRHTKHSIFFIILPLLLSCGSSGGTRQDIPASANTDELTKLITQLPAQNEAENQRLFAELTEAGPASIRLAVRMLLPPGAGDDTYARYAVNGMAKYVSRPGAEDQRRMYEHTVLEELKSETSKPVRVFLMEQLGLTGSDRSIPRLRSYLDDEKLAGPAAQTLAAIDTPKAREALHQALSGTDGSRRVTIIKALGDLQFTPAAGDILPFAQNGDAQTRATALYALANIGQPMAADLLTEAADTTQSFQYTNAPSLRLLFARRLAEEEHIRQSSDIARDVLAGSEASHIKSAALAQLVDNEGDEAFGEVLEAAVSEDSELRAAALAHARQMPRATGTEVWISRLNQSPPEVQADIIAMLGSRDDASVLPELKPYLRQDNLHVRLAAIDAVVALGGVDELPALMNRLQKATDAQEIKALTTALLQLPSEDLLPTVAQALPEASSRTKAALIGLIGTRQAADYFNDVIEYATHQDEPVRRAALEALEPLATPGDIPELINLLVDAEAQSNSERGIIRQTIATVVTENEQPQQHIERVLQELEQSSGPLAVDLLHTLSLIGSEAALEAVEEATESSQPAIILAATEALANWPDPSPIPTLLDIIRTGPPSQSTIALEGYVRLVHSSKYSPKDKVQWLKDAAEVAKIPREKAIAIESLSNVQTSESLKAIAQYFDHSNETIRQQAIRSAAVLLAPQYQSSSSLNGTNGVLSVIEAAVSPELTRQIERQIRRIRTRKREAGEFTSLFNGRNLDGWTGATDAYYVEDGALISRPDASGNLYTEEEYSDFILRFEFRLTEGANNGLGIRAPLEGDAAYEGLELQILDNTAGKYDDLQPYQYHGSVYGIVPARRGHLKPVGQWNTQEVIARGSHITVRLNGETILDADIKEATTPQPADGRKHPGLERSSGHVGFLGHGSEVAFRNIRIQNLNQYLPDYSMGSGGNGDGLNQPPKGFRTLFNGRNLQGWKGLVGNPETRAEMNPDELARKQKKADSLMRAHWSVRNGILYFDGEGSHLCTVEDYGDFEMLLDWKIQPGGDSGVYLRGAPQVQIWDVTEWPQGSGGLYNNQQHASDPLTPADNAIGEWNRMRIQMIGERVTVHLNGQLVTENVVMENYWDRSRPIYPVGPIELQSHNTPLQFRNIFIREIPRTEQLFNGRDLTGWQRVGGTAGSWEAADGILSAQGKGGGWLSTTETYDDFRLELEYRLPEGGNSGVFLRAPREGNPAYAGMEIQILDDGAEQYSGLEPWQYTGSIYGIQAPSTSAAKGSGKWQKMVIIADGPSVEVTLNGQQVIDTNLTEHMDRVAEHPGLKRRRGYIGLQNHNTQIEYRNVNITEIE